MIKDNLQAFINFEQNDLAQLLLMVEFIYNNAKNASTNYKSFELNCGHYLHIFHNENLNPHLKLRNAEELSFKL